MKLTTFYTGQLFVMVILS